MCDVLYCAIHCMPLRQIPFQLLHLLNEEWLYLWATRGGRKFSSPALTAQQTDNRLPRRPIWSYFRLTKAKHATHTFLSKKKKRSLSSLGLEEDTEPAFVFLRRHTAFSFSIKFHWEVRAKLYLKIEVICQVSSDFTLKIRHRSMWLLQGWRCAGWQGVPLLWHETIKVDF